MLSLIIDTETTGLPLKGVPPSDPRQARVMQIAAMLLDEDKLVGSFYSRLFPDNWPEVHPMAFAQHGLTEEMCKQTGIGQSALVALLEELVDGADIVVAHNYKFDYQMITIEYELQGRLFQPKKHACTMELMTPICGLTKASGGPKWPNLAEALAKCHPGETINKAHDALSDVTACAKVWKWYNKCKTGNNAS